MNSALRTTVVIVSLAFASAVLSPGVAAENQKAIEEDWRKQDGIRTERAPATYAAAIELTLMRGDALLRELQTQRVRLAGQAEQWNALRNEWRAFTNDATTTEAAWENLWQRVHRLRREIVFANPLADTGPLLFVKQVPGIFSHQLTQYYGSCARPGGGIFMLEAPGRSLTARQLGAGALPLGSYQHPEVSFDGRRILFAYCRTETVPSNRESHLDRFYHLYEMSLEPERGVYAASPRGPAGAFGVSTSIERSTVKRPEGRAPAASPSAKHVRQLTDGPFDDFSPRCLPNGEIIFISTRRGGFHRCGRGPCATYTLSKANADGSNPRSISFHETHEWDPVVLWNGQILYTRWDYVDRHAVFYEQLWTARPDGSGVAAYYGNNTFNPVGVWEARPVPGSTRVMATAGAHHAMTAGSIILLDVTRGQDGLEPITRLTPDALFPESEAPVRNRTHAAAWTAHVEGAPPRVPVEQVRWPGHCYRTPFPLSEKYFLAAYSFDSLIGEPDANPSNMFGIYLVDSFGNKELLHRDPGISSLWPMPLKARTRPPHLASPLDSNESREGTFLVQNVYESWPKLPAGKVTRLRILEVLPKTTWHANEPMVGLANASPGKQVLGTVPVEADGSAFFRAPAETPLAFQALDERGEAVQTMRSVTYLQRGENASCVGCHESRQYTPASAARPTLAARRAPSAIEPAPDGSRPLSYPRLVQPVLDQHCVRCHGPARTDGGIVLTGEPRGRFSRSYHVLAPRVSFAAWGGKPGDFRTANSEPVTQPGFFGARNSSLMTLLRRGHYDAKLSAVDFERLATWMDANALFYGTFEPAEQRRQLRGENIAVRR